MESENPVKRKSKDSVFTKLFQDKNNLLRLFKELHPEEKEISADDIEIDTLESIIVNTLCNDLGFTAGNRFLFLYEAQSDWDQNIAIRFLLYFTETLQRFLNRKGMSVHRKSKLELPLPEFYLIYSGSGEKPDTISLSEEFFGGSPNIELKIKVISEVDTETISGQYIGFCKVFNEQRKLHGNSMVCAKETFRICIEKGYLSDFLKSHETEVISMMDSLFDEEYLRMQYDKEAKAEAFEQGTIKTLLNLFIQGLITKETAEKQAGLSIEKMKELADKYDLAGT